MTVILVLGTFILFLTLDYVKTRCESRQKTFVLKGTSITTSGFEMLGALAQDGGEPVSTLISEEKETEEVLSKMKRTKSAGVTIE